MEETSILAFRELVTTGKLNNCKEIVFKAIEEFPKKTAKELEYITRLNINNVTGRIGDLEKEGLVCSIEKGECSITGMNAKLWVRMDNTMRELVLETDKSQEMIKIPRWKAEQIKEALSKSFHKESKHLVEYLEGLI